jgi:hypothetical protein
MALAALVGAGPKTPEKPNRCQQKKQREFNRKHRPAKDEKDE